VYAVSLTVSNTFGSTPLVQTAYITVADTGEQVLFADGFENGLIQWTRTNPDNSRTWKTTAVGGSTAGSQAAYVDLYAYADIGQRDYLTSPVIDLRDQSHPRLRLVHAYRSYSGTEPDSLIIRVSVDSGQSFPHRVLALGGASMGTTTPATTSFFPQTSLDWCQASGGADCQEINLQAFEGEAGFVFRIESVNGYGNNLFIDQVQLNSSCRGALSADPAIGAVPARVYPNPARSEVWLEASVPAPGQVQCVVMNLTGQVVAAQTLAVTPGQTSYPIALPSVVPGWYLIRCEGAGVSLRQPLILE
jgi:PKD repeat protein